MKKERQLNATRRDLLRGALGVSAVASVNLAGRQTGSYADQADE
jgi:hypothetical protein